MKDRTSSTATALRLDDFVNGVSNSVATIATPRPVPVTANSDAEEALRRVQGRPAPIRPPAPAVRLAAEIGPREPGVVYRNVDGDFRVLDLITDESEACRVLRRRSAQFAVVIIDTLRPDAEPFAIGSTWTGSDRVLKAVA